MKSYGNVPVVIGGDGFLHQEEEHREGKIVSCVHCGGHLKPIMDLEIYGFGKCEKCGQNHYVESMVLR